MTGSGTGSGIAGPARGIGRAAGVAGRGSIVVGFRMYLGDPPVAAVIAAIRMEPPSTVASDEETPVLGRMPTDHVVTMLAASPPQRAVSVLLGMPRDRIDKLLGAMDGRLIGRMLIAADPGRREVLLTHLSDSRLAAELALLPLVETARVLAALPSDRAAAQLERVAPAILTLLLDALPASHQKRLAALLDPIHLVDLRRADYERAVIESLRRTAARLEWVPDVRGANLLAGVFHRLFGISLCYVDGGTLPSRAVAAAQQVFVAEQVHGVLLISNAEPSAEASELTLDARYAQTPALVVTWDREDNDGLLGRALVRLAG